MGVFDDVKSWTKTQATGLTEGVKKIKNKRFMDATVAGCAMVAFADGTVKPEEKAKMAGFIQRNDALNVFDMSEVIASFEKYVQGFEFDIQIGKAEALKVIGKVKKNSEEAKLLLRVCCAVGMADGDFNEQERKTVRDICQELGLNPAEFDLQEKTGSKDGVPDWMQK
ncbi:tellurite resistance TerB family protein [Desulfobacterales bacterium HSG2]|nr:tellurite resistance TerB family protein [Desulfobacterales bacterium HSG2]